MKKFILLILIFIIHYSLFINHCESQWSDDTRLTNAPDTSSNNNPHARLIASNGNIIHTVWWDKRDGNREIYYKRSTNGGANWEQDTRLTNNPEISSYPSIAVSGLNVHIVWVDTRDNYYEIYYKRSTDEGITWGSDARLTVHTTGNASYPMIAASGLLLFAFWHDFRDGQWEIYFKRSTDGGINWDIDRRLTNNTNPSRFPSCEISGSVVHVIWNDLYNGTYQVFYNRSTDAGVTWRLDTILTNTISTSWFHPNLSAAGLSVHIVWNDIRDGNFEIYYKRSINGGMTWGADTRLTFDPATSYFPTAAVSGSNVHIVWHEDRDGNNEIYYKLSTDGGVNWSTDTRLTNDPSISERPFLSISNSILHVVWSDYRDGNYEIYYKRNPTGNVGIQNISSEIPKEFKLFQNYPNPFNPTTKIKFDLPKSNLTLSEAKGLFVQLKIYDLTGKEIQTLVNESLQPGTYEFEFDGTNYSTGVYFYKLTTPDFSETKSMLMIK